MITDYICFVRNSSTEDLERDYRHGLLFGDWDEDTTREMQIIRRELCRRNRLKKYSVTERVKD